MSTITDSLTQMHSTVTSHIGQLKKELGKSKNSELAENCSEFIIGMFESVNELYQAIGSSFQILKKLDLPSIPDSNRIVRSMGQSETKLTEVEQSLCKDFIDFKQFEQSMKRRESLIAKINSCTVGIDEISNLIESLQTELMGKDARLEDLKKKHDELSALTIEYDKLKRDVEYELKEKQERYAELWKQHRQSKEKKQELEKEYQELKKIDVSGMGQELANMEANYKKETTELKKLRKELSEAAKRNEILHQEHVDVLLHIDEAQANTKSLTSQNRELNKRLAECLSEQASFEQQHRALMESLDLLDEQRREADDLFASVQVRLHDMQALLSTIDKLRTS